MIPIVLIGAVVLLIGTRRSARAAYDSGVREVVARAASLDDLRRSAEMARASGQADMAHLLDQIDQVAREIAAGAPDPVVRQLKAAARGEAAQADLIAAAAEARDAGMQATASLLESQAAPEPPDLPAQPIIRLGDRGPLVKQAQELLIARGYKSGKDGVFTAQTERAVRAFQRDHTRWDGRALDVTGVIASPTWWALENPAADDLPLGMSPWSDVSADRWGAFVRALATQGDGAGCRAAGTIAPNGRLGAFLYDPRRLAALGLMRGVRREGDRIVGEFAPPIAAEKWLGDLALQARTLAADMKRIRKAIEADHGEAIGRDLAGSSATLSGLLAVVHVAGLPRLRSWIASDEDKQRFPATTEAYRRANGVF